MELKKSGPDTSLRISCMESLLVIKPSSLGDIVHGLQVVQTLARERPACRVSWVVAERFAGLVQAAPFVHETIVFRRRDGWRGYLRALGKLRGRRYDVVWDMQGTLRSAGMALVVTAPEKWARHDAREGSGLLLNRRIGPPLGEAPYHAINRLLPFLASAGVEMQVLFPLGLKPVPVFAWRDFFSGDPRTTFVIFTDSRGVEKEWPHFDELTAMILDEIPGSRVAWCAGQPAAPARAVPPGRFLNLTGCPLDEMIALVRQPMTFIGNDSGPMHLAAASGNRVLSIFGPTDAREFGPYPASRPTNLSVSAPGGRLHLLTVHQVFSFLKKLGTT